MLRTGRVSFLYVAPADGHGEPLLPPAGREGEENCLWFAEECCGLDRPDRASRDFWSVHALDLPSCDDGIALAITNFSYPAESDLTYF